MPSGADVAAMHMKDKRCRHEGAKLTWYACSQSAQRQSGSGAEAAAIAMQEREVLRVMVNNANNGGLLSVLDGLPAFVPFSLVPKAPNERLTVEVCAPAEPAVSAGPAVQGGSQAF